MPGAVPIFEGLPIFLWDGHLKEKGENAALKESNIEFKKMFNARRTAILEEKNQLKNATRLVANNVKEEKKIRQGLLK